MIRFALSACGFLPERMLYLNELVLPAWLREATCPKLFVDASPSSCWLSARRSWAWLAETRAPYVCSLFDDFVPDRGAREHIEALVRRHPENPVTFFQPAVLRVSDLATMGQGDFEIPFGQIAWGGCLVVPRALVSRMLRIADQISCFTGDDNKIQAAFDGMGIRVWCGGQNAVTHIGAYLPSLTSAESAIEVQDYRSGELVRRQLARSTQARASAGVDNKHFALDT